jgi:hypothetical protein
LCRRWLGGANALEGTVEGGRERAGNARVFSVRARQNFDHVFVYGAGDGQWRCLARYWKGVECARASGWEGKDDSVQATACSGASRMVMVHAHRVPGTFLARSGRARSGQCRGRASSGRVLAESLCSREAIRHGVGERRGSDRSSACVAGMVHAKHCLGLPPCFNRWCKYWA